MKFILYFFMLAIFAGNVFSQDPYENFFYLDPVPGSKYINPVAVILIRPKADININSLLNNNSVLLKKNNSENILYTSKITDHGKIISIKPSSDLVSGDSIFVYFTNAITKTNGNPIQPFSYKFYVSSNTKDYDLFSSYYRKFLNDEYLALGKNNPPGKISFTSSEPVLTVNYSHFPSPGKLFFNNLTMLPTPTNRPSLLIADNEGNYEFVREMENFCYDLNIQPNGMLTYYDDNTDKYYALNSNYNIIDSFYCGNGYKTDLHELRILPDGHFLLMSYDTRSVTDIGGESPLVANVVGVIIQELDENKEVVFQFRSWDYFKILDATHENLNSPLIDYCHANAIELDTDGNILISSRNMDEITKISRTTGKIIWRLGGKNNQFTFINDPDGFSHQHAIRRIKNGNITLFDNGNFHNPPYSRAVEYKLDEVNKTATLVWQYRNSPDIYGFATGFVQRLENNNTIICWGLTNPTLAEVRYDGTKVLEMTLPKGVFSYRAFKYPWKELPNSEIMPANYSLLQNYPNPFNPSTNIKFTIPSLPAENSVINVNIKVFDITGRLVSNLLNDNFSSGTYSVNFNGAGFSSGVYFYRIQAGSFSDTKKMIYVK